MNYYSENLVDQYIRAEIFPNFDYKGIMIEVGGGPVKVYSNSQHFRETGWRTVCYDPNPKFVLEHHQAGSECYQMAISNFSGTSQFTIVDTGVCAPEFTGISYSAIDVRYDCPFPNRKEISVKVDTLTNELTRLNIDHIDILCVDVEGWELEVIEGLDFQRYRPRIVILENYTHNPRYIDFMLARSMKFNGNLNFDYTFLPLESYP
jgi:FkbM family methyltransferase